jgi:hypothetical protein
MARFWAGMMEICGGQQDIGHWMIRFSEGFPAETGPPMDLHQFNMSLTTTGMMEIPPSLWWSARYWTPDASL